jgi:hypothetical protein
MSHNISIHKVTKVRAVVSEPRNDIMGNRYCVTKILVTCEEGGELQHLIEIDLFGKGHAIDAKDIDTATEVYPFVELERPRR